MGTNGKHSKILIIDDEQSVRNLLQRILSEAGYEAETATNGQEGLDKMPQLRPEAIFLDIKMPGMSGMEVLKQLAARWPETCIIMSTAVAEVETAVEAMKLGTYDYITKPFNRDDVLLRARRALARRELARENERHQLELEKKVSDQAEQLRQQFADLVETLSREHKLLYQMADSQKGGRKALSRLPEELQKPMSSVEEFRDAMLKILKRT